MRIGKIKSIFRYPVKSTGGESVDEVELTLGGIPGDRGWAIRDEVRGEIVGGKSFPRLMEFSSRLREVSPGDKGQEADLIFPDGTFTSTLDPEISRKISEVLEHEVTLWPLLPAEELDHYRRGEATHSDMETELRAVFGREGEEPLPDLSVFPPEIFQFASPPGTYFDVSPLLILTSSSLATLQKRVPTARFDVRRFRPNFLIDAGGDADPFPELAWCGQKLRIGKAEIEILLECPRCVMTTHGFQDLPKDPGVMRALVKEAKGNLGVYAKPLVSGQVQVGDEIEIFGL